MFVCTKGCGKSLSSKQSQDRHSNQCTGLPRVRIIEYPCTKSCGKVFKSARSCTHHSHYCDGKKKVLQSSFECMRGCGKVLCSKQSAQKHSMTCPGFQKSKHVDRACPCPHKCGKTFSNKYNASRHAVLCPLRTQKEKTSERISFRCTKCMQVFSRSDALKRHEARCGVTFTCKTGCGAMFLTEYRCAKHEQECTYKRRQYWCPVCPYKGYVHLQHYESHRKMCSGQPPQSKPFVGTSANSGR